MPDWCPNCHVMLSPGLDKCPMCGHKIDNSGKEEFGNKEILLISWYVIRIAAIPLLLGVMVAILCLMSSR